MDHKVVDEVLELLKKRGVDPKNLYDILNDVLQRSNMVNWETCKLSVPILYMLKDVVWYNMEHLPQGGSDRGQSSLCYLGTKFPTLAKIALEDVYIDSKEIVALDEELNQVLQLWSSQLVLTRLNLSDREAVMEKLDQVLITIYDVKRETPFSTGFSPYNQGSVFLDKLGHHIIGSRENVLCELDGKVGEFELGKMLYNTLLNLSEATKRARTYNKGVRLDIS